MDCVCEEAVAQCLVAWWLRCMPMGQCLAATHKWERSCIEGVPPPKGQRGLLVAAAVVGARSQMEVEELSGWLTHTHVIASQQAQPLLDPFVLLCRVASHSSALQVEETGPLVAGEQRKREEE